MAVRLFTDDGLAVGGTIEISDGRVHYLRHVMRLKVGDPVLLFNGREGEWAADITKLGKRSVDLIVVAQRRPQTINDGPVLMIPPIKKHRMAWLIEKAVELGVAAFQPVITQHTQASLDRPERLERMIAEAAEQCERLTLPEVAPPLELRKAVALQRAVLFGVARADAPPAAELLGADPMAALLVGPEGGFSEQEVSWLCDQRQCKPVRLAKNVLRAETAALVFLSQWQAFGRDLGGKRLKS